MYLYYFETVNISNTDISTDLEWRLQDKIKVRGSKDLCVGSFYRPPNNTDAEYLVGYKLTLAEFCYHVESFWFSCSQRLFFKLFCFPIFWWSYHYIASRCTHVWPKLYIHPLYSKWSTHWHLQHNVLHARQQL
jgi:hypothetical protein